MPKLSVLMPVFNAEKFLKESIDSILNQSFSEFEFIIIDDCSTDNSVSIIESYSDPRIRLIKNDRNRGISATLNKGISLASTDIIARMDADDISYPNRLEIQFAYLQENPDCAMVSSLVRVISESGHFLKQDRFESRYFYYNLTFICWIYHPTVMYRKGPVLTVGGYSVPYAEDFELFWQLSRKYKFFNIPEVLLDYRVTNQSLHQVLKKQEYAEAQHAQLMRNFRFYAGEDYNLPDSFIECFQHNFLPLLEENNLGRVIACIRELDFLSACILAKENINKDSAAVKEAVRYKKRFILNFFARNLSPFKGTLLLIRFGYLGLLAKIIRSKISH